MKKKILFTGIIGFIGTLSTSASSIKEKPLIDLFKKDYPEFVKELNKNIHDPKFEALLRAGDGSNDKITFESTSYKAADLIPTQNEIDVEKSLKYPLAKEKEETLKAYLTATPKDIFAPGGSIVTAGGKYIIDGHHRWSQLYLINPEARIKAINMKIEGTGDEIAQKALRIAQLAIGYTNENIPVSLVEGQNLLTMNETDLKQWVKEHLSDNAIKAFSEINITTPDAIANYIWEKTTQMRENNPPIKGASNRGYMPQTDKAPEWQSNLQKGLVNVRY